MFSYANGDKYDGEWTDDIKGPTGNTKANSIGAYNYINGNKYEGDIDGNAKTGKGVFKYYNGDEYEGNWIKDIKEGNGRAFS
jgi:hypothetical protein